ncbi:mitochondrial chaperone BCS1 [Nemania sp. FL0916]|nr:mitochondrial chaperone BCS1 [Nemania sp. FL0916]
MCEKESRTRGRGSVAIFDYSRNRWYSQARKPIRRLETVHLDSDEKKSLLDDIQKYLDPRTKRLYQTRAMPYRRGYLFYGQPGTGKSSLTFALAGELGLDLFELKIPLVQGDQELAQMFQELPPRCLVVLEDIDVVWTNRDSIEPPKLSQIPLNPPSSSSAPSPGFLRAPLPVEEAGRPQLRCTLSGLLNALDGVSSSEGRIVIMTTNKFDRLDPALIRPGRIDRKVKFGNISRKSAAEMFVRMFTPDNTGVPYSDGDQDGTGKQREKLSTEALDQLASQFSAQVPEDTFTPSKLQGFFQEQLTSSAEEAVAGIAAWVEKERPKYQYQ